jgi:biopolymer transport protein ExbD
LKFEKKEQVTSGIPTASLPDIIFMLLIFFMVATVFKEFRGITVVLPQTEKVEKLKGKRDVAYLWADKAGNISIDDKIVPIDRIANIMYPKVADPEHPLKLVSLKIDKDVKMELVVQIHEELREAGGGALNVNYSSRQVGK